MLGRMTVGNRHGLLVPMATTDQVGGTFSIRNGPDLMLAGCPVFVIGRIHASYFFSLSDRETEVSKPKQGMNPQNAGVFKNIFVALNISESEKIMISNFQTKSKWVDFALKCSVW